MLADEAVNHFIETRLGLAKLHDSGDRPMQEQLDARKGDDEVVEVHDGVGIVVDATDCRVDFGVEQGAGDDFEREFHRSGSDVEGLAGDDAVGGSYRGFDDLGGIRGDALAMKGRRSDAALTHVERLFGRDKSVAEKDLHPLHSPLFHERIRLRDEDLADVFGVVDEDDGRPHETVVGDVAVGLMEMLEEQDGASELHPRLEGVEGQRTRQPGRESVLRCGHGYASVAALR